MSIHLSLSDVPTHVVLWQEKEKLTQLVESLVQRIGTLEASVNSLLTKTKKDTPLLSGIDTRRGVPPLNIVQEADPRNLLKELIETAPLPGLSALPGLPGNMYEVTNADSNVKLVQVSDTKNTMATPSIYTSMLVDSERCYVEAKNEERTRRKRDMFGSQASSTVATETTQNSEDEEIEIEIEEEQEQEQADAEEEEQEAEEEQEVEEQQEVEVDADAEEDAQEEEEQQEELTEFEFKGVTYWRDSENQVYKVDDDGDLDDTPFGLWSSDKNKILKFQSV